MKLQFIVLFFLWTKGIICEWIDPHDMNTNEKAKYKFKKSASTSSLQSISKEVNVEATVYSSHIRRIVSVLVNSAHVDKNDPNIFYGHIRFNIEPEDFDFLTLFSKEDVTLDKLRRLERIFSESFNRSMVTEYFEKLESLQLKLYSIIVNVHNLWLLGACFMLYIVYQLFKNNFSFAYIIKYLIIMVFVCDFVFRYQYLLEEAEEHNVNVKYSSICDTSKMSWGDWIKFLSSTRDCERKTVTPLDAFLFQIKNLIIVPLNAVGSGMGGFGKELFRNLPWPWSFILWPIMLLFVIILFALGMAFFTRSAIELNIFHLFKLKFGSGHSSQNILSGATVERLMGGVLHRPMIQNVTVPNNSTPAQFEEVEVNKNKESKRTEKDSDKETRSNLALTKKNEDATLSEPQKVTKEKISQISPGKNSGSISLDHLVKEAQNKYELLIASTKESENHQREDENSVNNTVVMGNTSTNVNTKLKIEDTNNSKEDLNL